MAYDAVHGDSVMFGLGAGGGDLDDTWARDGTGWTDEAPAVGGPSGRDSHVMAYDAKTRHVVLFGGNDGAGRALDDTWAWDNVAWSEVTPASGNPPPSEYAIAYDPDIGRVLLYGGGPDMYEWDGSGWTDVAP